MPRKVRDAKVDTRTARAKLKPQGKPYYRGLAPGIQLGYRKGKAGGRWCVRWRPIAGRYRLETLPGIADDNAEPDGIAILSYGQAHDAALKRAGAGVRPAPSGPYTVAEAVADYVAFLRAERKTADDAEKRLAKHVLPALAPRPVAELRQDELEAVKRGMVRRDADDPEVERRSRDSANRVLSSLKAALNRAFRDPDRGIDSDAAWRKVKPFQAVGRARQVHLDAMQARRLVNACSGRFRDLVTAGLLTGARYGELAGLLIADFRADLRTLNVRGGKTGARDVVLTPEGVRFFETLAAGRHPDALLLPKDNGEAWRTHYQSRPMAEAVARAKLPTMTFYALRHTAVSQALLAGLNPQILAENIGTSTRMLEQHYAHFLASSRRKLIEAHGFKLGLKISKKVEPLRPRGGRA